MTHHAQHTQAIKRRQRRTTSVQRHDVMHLPRVFTALLAPPVLSPQLRDPQQLPLARPVDLTSDAASQAYSRTADTNCSALTIAFAIRSSFSPLTFVS